MDKLQTILREYLNKGSEKIDVTMVLALIDQFKKDTNKQLLLHNVSQQRELFNAILDFSEELPMCTEDYHRSELWEKYKALNCC